LKDYPLEYTGSFPRRKPLIKHLVHSLGLLVFALILVGGAVGLFFLNRIGRADELMYVLAVENLGAMAELREEFVSLPTQVRNLIIETSPDRMGVFRETFDGAKESVTDQLGHVGRMIAGYPEKERLAKEVEDRVEAYWARADECIAICLANKKPEALRFMREQADPDFQASLQAMGVLQENMRAEALSQLKSNRAIATSASAAMAVCVVLMGLLAIVFAVRIVRLT
jgi:methyl-accepting chemotaxis protein-1 (serine sensor receptor)